MRYFHRPKTRFVELRGLVVECLGGYTKLDRVQVKDRIRESYQLQDIDAAQYDWLIDQLQ